MLKVLHGESAGRRPTLSNRCVASNSLIVATTSFDGIAPLEGIILGASAEPVENPLALPFGSRCQGLEGLAATFPAQVPHPISRPKVKLNL